MAMHHRRKQDNKQIWSYVILFIIVVGFLATVGFQALVQGSLFISSLSNKRTSLGPRDDSLIFTPELIGLPEATNSAQLLISGSAPIGYTVTIVVNDAEQEDLPELASTEFETEVSLDQGENILAVLARKDGTGELTSKNYQVYYSDKEPEMKVDAPADGTTTRENEIEVKGSTSAGNHIFVNGRPVVAGSDQTWSTFVRLQQGENIITAKVVDQAGNTKEQMIKVVKE